MTYHAQACINWSTSRREAHMRELVCRPRLTRGPKCGLADLSPTIFRIFPPFLRSGVFLPLPRPFSTLQVDWQTGHFSPRGVHSILFSLHVSEPNTAHPNQTRALSFPTDLFPYLGTELSSPCTIQPNAPKPARRARPEPDIATL